MKGLSKLDGAKAILFDVFGTLVEICDKRQPFAQLLSARGRVRNIDDATAIMTSNVGVSGAAQLLGIDLEPRVMAEIEINLYAELQSVRPFPEVVGVLKRLRDCGYKIGLCSNLAAPYAIPVKLLLSDMIDTAIWSFDVGYVKPDRKIYERSISALGCAPHEVVMVGDTLEADFHGPRRVGIRAIHLSRNRTSPVTDSIDSLAELL